MVVHGGNSNSPIPRRASGNFLRAPDKAPPYAKGMKSNLDPPRALLVATVANRGLHLSTLSLAIGKAHSYLQQYVKRGIPRVLPEDVRERLAAELQVSPEALRGAVPGKGAPKPAAEDSIAVTADETDMLRAFRALSPEARRRALLILPTLD
jgi:lambda repressor-like predicted transcriptional regulator